MSHSDQLPNSDKPSGFKLSRIWYDPVARGILFQVVAIGAVALFFLNIISNTLGNLEARGISTGFAFLDESSGFAIIQSLVEYDETHTYGRTFTVGVLNTLLVSGLGIILATVLGFIMGVARLSHNWIVAKFATIFVETLRNIPLLLQIFFWYFAVLQVLPGPRQSLSIGESVFLNVRGLYLPKPVFEAGAGFFIGACVFALLVVIRLYFWAKYRKTKTGQGFPVFTWSLITLLVIPGIAYFLSGSPVSLEYPALKGFNFRGGITVIPELVALLLALTLYTAAFIGEIVRSGILSVNKGQTEAAFALGLSRKETLKLVIIPQAMRVIIPPLTSQYLNLTKNSSLATAIGYPDLVSVFMGTTLNQTGQAIEVIMMTMAVYLSVSLFTSILMNIYNRRMMLIER